MQLGLGTAGSISSGPDRPFFYDFHVLDGKPSLTGFFQMRTLEAVDAGNQHEIAPLPVSDVHTLRNVTNRAFDRTDQDSVVIPEMDAGPLSNEMIHGW